MNRTQVLERLLLGRMLEAETRTDTEGRRSFIEVRPLIDESVAELKANDVSIESVLSRSRPNANVIKSYQVRHCTLSPGWETYPDDWDRFTHRREWLSFDSLADLETALLENFALRLEELKMPGETESPL